MGKGRQRARNFNQLNTLPLDKASRIFIPTLAVATIFGLIDAARAIGFDNWIPEQMNALPGANLGLSWIVPVLVVLVLAIIWDKSQKPHQA